MDGKRPIITLKQIQQSRSRAQEKYKDHKTLSHDFKVDECVKVKITRILPKGESKYSNAKKIIRVMDHAVKLCDGKIWNKSKIARTKLSCRCQTCKGEADYWINDQFELANHKEQENDHQNDHTMICRNNADVSTQKLTGNEKENSTSNEDVTQKQSKHRDITQKYRPKRVINAPKKYEDFILTKRATKK